MVEASGPRSTASATGFFRVPDLFVRLSSKAAPSISSSNGVDPDSIWSPTSPLDSSARSLLRSSPPRVGLGLVDALNADAGSLLFGGGKASTFLDSIRPFLELGLGGLPKPAAAAARRGKPASTSDEVARGHADSEEYTCVIARGANPRTTHILGGGETLEVRGPRGGLGTVGCGKVKVAFTVEPFTERPAPAPVAGVASGRCRCCMRRLPEDMDIFIYKGEKAFCSRECREGYIEVEVDDAQESPTPLDHAGSSTAFFLGEDW